MAIHHYAHDENLFREGSAPSPLRADLFLAFAAAAPTSVTAVALSGSLLLGVLTAAFTVACVALAALMI